MIVAGTSVITTLFIFILWPVLNGAATAAAALFAL